ncbi:polysaccharide deacetylase family protein [Thalassobaculum sp.]|jgi:peptidoglycan/xylan/chitin deacetylase (PgdA/CDA1 family)|uniref:polysaccharide deacetylase family protein n=1 Tax=Thalassobaculum sp. TaxID=2022740 RepID=UPI003B5A50E4
MKLRDRAVAFALTLTGLLAAPATAPLGVGVPSAFAADSAVLFMYHRFGEAEYPSANIRIDQFEEQLEELRTGGYKVLPLPEILEKMRTGADLPDRTIALTIDDAYASVYAEAWPRLKKAGFPFTLFVATDPIDRASPGYMTWDQIRELQAGGATIGSQTASHPHLPDLDDDTVKIELDRAASRLADELGQKPTLFAYPYGEYGLRIEKIVAERGYVAAFGQQSGVVHATSDRYGLPRFALNETYGGIDRFRLTANALPLPIRDRVPADLIVTSNNPPPFGFTVAPEIGDPSRIDCYASGQGRTQTEVLGDRVEVRLSEPFPAGRARVNCTMPGPDGRWHWYGIQFYIPR